MTGAQILVVEDNDRNMKLFRDVLQATGFRTLEATTGERAVELAIEHAPDLVLMDVRLPDIDGIQALGRLRADERTAGVPVVALTAQAMEGDRERFLAAGFDGYLSKPVDIRELVATVGRHCGEGSAMSGTDTGRILVVDDVPANVRLLEAMLLPHGFDVVSAVEGRAALELAGSAKPDLVLLDVMMPGLDGYAVCRRLREREETAVLPVIMVTASEGTEKVMAIEAGADDFVTKPFDRHELLARIRSLLRIKRYHDTIAELNRTLERRVQQQVAELERLRRLQRFLSPQLADAIVTAGDESILGSHRRQVAMLFADLRGWTRFADSAEPEEVMRVLGRVPRRDRPPRRPLRCDRGVPPG